MGACFSAKRTPQELDDIVLRLLKDSDEKTLYTWVQEHREEWWLEDLALWQQPPRLDNPGDWTRMEAKQTTYKGLIFDVFVKDTREEPKWAYAYWNGNPGQIAEKRDDNTDDNGENLDMVLDFFMRQVKYTKHWTPIFTYSHCFLDRPDVCIHIQRYEPTQPGVEPRNLIGIYALKRLKEAEYPPYLKAEMDEVEKRYGVRPKYRVAMLSQRSLPDAKVNTQLLAGEKFIDWKASQFFVDRCRGQGVAIDKKDAEDEGGFLLEDLIKSPFGDEVQLEARDCTKFMYENATILAADYRTRRQQASLRITQDHLSTTPYSG
jgi:hypothetical protein